MSAIYHHHLLARIETQKCPQKRDRRHMERVLEQLVADIRMKKLGRARIYYVGEEQHREEMGMSGILPIETSHVSFHFWSHPARSILHSEKSKCLLQFDLYTCGKLSKKQIKEILHIFDEYMPSRANLTLINRKFAMKIESQTEWDGESKTWNSFVNHYCV